MWIYFQSCFITLLKLLYFSFFFYLYDNMTQFFSETGPVSGFSGQGTVIVITWPPPKDVARNAIFSELSKFCLDKYVVKSFKRHLLEEALLSRLLCPIQKDFLQFFWLSRFLHKNNGLFHKYGNLYFRLFIQFPVVSDCSDFFFQISILTLFL